MTLPALSCLRRPHYKTIANKNATIASPKAAPAMAWVFFRFFSSVSKRCSRSMETGEPTGPRGVKRVQHPPILPLQPFQALLGRHGGLLRRASSQAGSARRRPGAEAAPADCDPLQIGPMDTPRWATSARMGRGAIARAPWIRPCSSPVGPIRRPGNPLVRGVRRSKPTALRLLNRVIQVTWRSAFGAQRECCTPGRTRVDASC